MSDRKSNIMVTVIDGEAFGEQVREQMKDHLPPGATLKLLQGMGFVKTKRGTFILDTDGFGPCYPIEENPVEVAMTRADIMTCMPYTHVPVNKDNLHCVPVSGKVNLADFIRVFGRRLEGNFQDWNDSLMTAGPLPESLENSQVPA